VHTMKDLAVGLTDTQQVLKGGKIRYKPADGDQHLNMKENFDHLYERIIRLENGM